jgi:hypothetical protein
MLEARIFHLVIETFGIASLRFSELSLDFTMPNAATELQSVCCFMLFTHVTLPGFSD